LAFDTLWEEFAQQTKREMYRKEEANLQNDKKKEKKIVWIKNS